MRLPYLFAILIAASQAISGCDSKDDDDGPLAVQQFIDTCSPFNTMSGDRHMEAKSKVIGLDHNHLKFGNYLKISDDPGKTSVDVDYTIDDKNKTVTVMMKTGPVTYHVAAITDSACALLSGDPTKANLNESWFGEKDDD